MIKKANMDNNEFDKIFSIKLQEEQSFQFNESDWNTITEKLNYSNKNKKGKFRFLLISLLLLFLIGTIVCLAFELMKSKRELLNISSANTESNEVKSERNTNVDTFYSKTSRTTFTNVKQGIKPYDFEPIEKHNANLKNNNKLDSNSEENNQKLNPINLVQELNKSISSNEISKTKSSSEEYISDLNRKINEIDRLSSENENSKNIIISSNKRSVKNIYNLNKLPLQINLLDRKIAIINGVDEVRINNKSILEKDKSDYFSLGVFNGWSNVSSYFNPFENIYYPLTAIKNKKYAYEFGASLVYLFKENIELFAIFSYRNSSSKILPSESIWIEDFITGMTNKKINILEVGVKQKTINQSLGINYRFLKNKKLSPFLGISLEASYLSSLQLNWTYYSYLENPYNYEIINSRQNIHQSTYLIHSLNPAIGFRLKISKKCNLQTQVSHSINLKTDKDFIFTTLGIRSSIFYNF